MSTRYVRRPRPPSKKIHSKNEFELCYLRHKYFRKVKYNPKPSDMKPFMHIVSYLAKNTYFRYQNLFRIVGFETDDLINIGNVHLVSFLGLFSLGKMKDKYKDFVDVFTRIQEKKPEKKDILDKNQANFTLFLRQRMEDVVRVCRQKARNIKGIPYEECRYYYGSKKPPKRLSDLVKNCEKFGFRKLDAAVFKTIKRRAGLVHTSMFDFAGNYYVAISIERTSLRLEDFSGAGIDPHDSIHNMSPEDIYLKNEDVQFWEQTKEEFRGKPDSKRAIIIRDFIDQNKGNKKFVDEIKTAKRLLRGLESNG
jgi:hypothetical protein